MAVAVTLDYGSLDAPLTSQSRALPDGWTRGIEFSDLTCLTPTVMGECPASTVVVTPGVNEVQTFTLTSGGGDGTPPTGGTFTLTFPEGTTAPIAFNASAAAIDAAIEAVLGAGSVTVTGALPGPVTITYTEQEPRAQVTGSGAALTGTGAPYTVATATTTEGAAPVTEDTNLKPTQRPGLDAFHPVEVISALECTTRGNVDVAAFASSSLDRTRDYALAREMLTGAASARDAGTNPANPSLVDTATDLGAVFTSVAASLACLEQSLQEATSGQSGYILAGVDWASYALAERVIWRDGARWRTAGGSTVIISAGFDGRAPVAAGPGTPPAAGAALYAYAVANLWAGFGTRSQYTDVNRAVNTAHSRAEDVALAAFPTCAVFAAASTAATAC